MTLQGALCESSHLAASKTLLIQGGAQVFGIDKKALSS